MKHISFALRALGDTPPIPLAMRRPLGGNTQILTGFWYTILTLLALIALPVFAQQEPPQRPQMTPEMQEKMRAHMQQRMRETDVDGDGAVSREEFMKQAEARFARADLNSDGKITKEEFGQMRQRMMQRMPR